MKLSRTQARAQAVRVAKAAARFHIIRDCSDEGLTKADAAARAGLSVGGVDTMLYRVLGTSRWPITEDILAEREKSR